MSETDALAGPSIVARADALMQRRRTQASSQTPGLDLPVLTEKLPDLADDLPVLTEVAANPTVAPPESPATAPPPTSTTAPLDKATLDKLAQELTSRVRERIEAELPMLVEAALQVALPVLTDQLKSGLSDITDEAIHDFLTESEKKVWRPRL